MVSLVLAGAVGYFAGAFTPAVGRRIKALFVSKTQGAVSAEVAKVEATVVADVKKNL